MSSRAPLPPIAPPPPRRFVDNPWIVLGLLFLVTAALGLPLLWLSRGFSRPAKVILSIVVCLYTALLLWAFVRLMLWCYHRVMDAWG